VPGVLTAFGQTNALLTPIPLAKRPEIQGSDQPIASHHCLHSGTRIPAQCRKLLFSHCSRMAPCLH